MDKKELLISVIYFVLMVLAFSFVMGLGQGYETADAKSVQEINDSYNPSLTAFTTPIERNSLSNVIWWEDENWICGCTRK